MHRLAFLVRLPLLSAILLFVSACAAGSSPPGMLDPLGSFLGAPLGQRPRDLLAGEWEGRYSDKGGGGEIRLILQRKEDTLHGSWQVSTTGSSGTFRGVLASGDRSLAFAMLQADSACPGAFIGTLLLTEGRLLGAYEGGDCRGEIKDGKLELIKK